MSHSEKTEQMTPQAKGSSKQDGMVIAIAIAIIHFVLHLFTNGNYGMFRDEFYYIACSDHLAFGYVDHPPLSILILAGSRALLGDSVGAVRFTVAVVGAVVVFGGAVLARELGGGRFARILAALAVAISPLYLGFAGFFSMNTFDLLFWMLAYFIMARILKTGAPRLFLLFGAVMGLGMLNKISMFTCAMGLAVGLLLVPQRRLYKDRRLWLGGIVAVAIFLPHLIWQLQNGWPTLEFIQNAKRYKIAGFSAGGFLIAQILQMHPLNLPIWVIGLISLLVARRFRPYRALGAAFLASLIFLMEQTSKAYYIGPAYTLLLAAGACAIEEFTRSRNWRWIRPSACLLLLLGGIVTLPLAVPVLPVEKLISYQDVLGLRAAPQEKSGVGVVDQHFADRFGWENLVSVIASVYESMPEDDRAECTVLASNYGEAGAVDYYGPRYGLPSAISGHNNYFLWGPGDISGDVVISVGIPIGALRGIFADVTVAAVIISPYAMPYETNLPVCVCRNLTIPLSDAWQRVRNFI